MGNIALFLCCLLAGGYVFYETGTYPHPPDVSLDAGLYPRFLVYVLLFLAAMLGAGIVRQGRAGLSRANNLPSARPLLMIGSMIAYCLLLKLVGYAVATVCFAFAATLLFRGSVKDGLLVGVGITAFLELLFRGGFQVPLPNGMLNLF